MCSPVERSPPCGQHRGSDLPWGGRNTEKKGDFYKSRELSEATLVFSFVIRCQWKIHGFIFISQEKAAPPSQHESGLFLSGPPPTKGWEGVNHVVESCSVSSPAEILAPLSQTPSDNSLSWRFCPNDGICSELFSDRSGLNLDLSSVCSEKICRSCHPGLRWVMLIFYQVFLKYTSVCC